MAQDCASVAFHQREALVYPAGDAANHLLHRPALVSEPDLRAIGAIAVRPRAVDDEQSVGRILLELARGDARVRQIDGARKMAAPKELRATDVEQHEAARLRRSMDVPAVGFEFEKAAEVLQGIGAAKSLDPPTPAPLAVLPQFVNTLPV
jgi:hypothetical protein